MTSLGIISVCYSLAFKMEQLDTMIDHLLTLQTECECHMLLEPRYILTFAVFCKESKLVRVCEDKRNIHK